MSERTNRRTGAKIEVGRATDLGFDDDGGRWVTVCWTHSMVVNHQTREIAESWAAYPDEWCEDVGFGGEHDGESCRKVWEER